jgi:hypothetical protein
MAKRQAKKKTDAERRDDATTFAEQAVKTANANRAKVGARALTPRESINVFQAALSQYRRARSQPD